MKRFKKRIYILLLSVIIYFVLMYMYNCFFVNSNISNLVYLDKDIKRGDKVTKQDFKVLRVKDNISNTSISVNKLSDIENFIPKNNFFKGQIVQDDMFIPKNEYIHAENEKEIVSLKISNPDDLVSFQIEKGSVVNIYYTAKTAQFDNIANLFEKPAIKSGTVDSYTTIKLIENIEILNIFDKYGNVIELVGDKRRDLNIIDTIMIETEKETVIKINNLKKYGSFILSLER